MLVSDLANKLMSSKMIFIRSMIDKDVTDMLRIQAQCYTDSQLLETEEVIRSWPVAGFVRVAMDTDTDSVIGYAACQYIRYNRIPALNEVWEAGKLHDPQNPSFEYVTTLIHDVCVDPANQNKGIGKMLVDDVVKANFAKPAERMPIIPMQLVPVQNSERYWEKLGWVKSMQKLPEDIARQYMATCIMNYMGP